MRLKSRLFTLLGALITASSSFAAMTSSAPISCPSISAIKAAGVPKVHEYTPQVFFAYQISKYDTEYKWIFSIGYFKTDSKEQAIIDGNNTLLNLAGDPIPVSDEDYWFCRYDAGAGYTALALYTEHPLSPPLIKRFF